ncbi:hypothetical protein SAMN06272781_7360 [Streptomyces sp. 1222.2]|nr:hypothetical protein SAMN06272781_7360 [Streptomyces sp. 1222.2]
MCARKDQARLRVTAHVRAKDRAPPSARPVRAAPHRSRTAGTRAPQPGHRLRPPCLRRRGDSHVGTREGRAPPEAPCSVATAPLAGRSNTDAATRPPATPPATATATAPATATTTTTDRHVGARGSQDTAPESGRSPPSPQGARPRARSRTKSASADVRNPSEPRRAPTAPGPQEHRTPAATRPPPPPGEPARHLRPDSRHRVGAHERTGAATAPPSLRTAPPHPHHPPVAGTVTSGSSRPPSGGR